MKGNKEYTMKPLNTEPAFIHSIFKFLFLLLFIYPASHLVGLLPRKKQLWAFGTFTGKRYSDNARYLFEYVSSHHKEINAVWITKDKKIVSDLKKQKLNALYAYSINGIFASIRADIYFYCYTTSDINYWTSSGVKKVNLWHGTPMKKICRDIEIKEALDFKIYHASPMKALFYKITEPGYTERHDYICSPSSYVAPRLISAFDAHKDNIMITGYPVNDRLLTPQLLTGQDSSIKTINNHYSAQKKIIAYLPTYRQRTDKLPRYNWLELQHILESNDAIFVIKLHPLDKTSWDFTSFHNIIMLSHDTDIYPLMAITDCLITDYSSVVVDYLLLDRPIIYFAYDLDEYLSQDRGMYESFDDMIGGAVATNFDALLAEINSFMQGDDKHSTIRKTQIQKYHDYLDNKSCLRIINYLNSH